MQLPLLLDPEVHNLRERAEAILWVKTQMARYGIHLEDLHAAGCFDQPEDGEVAPERVLFRDAQGQTWDGRGDLPAWLQRAVNAGQSIEHFRVTATD
ncbi:H-NS family nucleoid-associated regulatory protein [Cupriavidus necator]|uniref:H-NS family nucleoid-associated regulatory protein n=1 Tax=Cupriavidus necator TaxID=106590 RepID=UPI0039C090F0